VWIKTCDLQPLPALWSQLLEYIWLTVFNLAGGVLDDTEIRLLERGIEIKLKMLANFPAHIPPCEPEDVIEDIVWIKGKNSMFHILTSL